MIDEGAIASAREARGRIARERSTQDLVRALARAGSVWSQADSQARRTAAPSLYAALPLAPAMIDHGLDLIFGALGEDGIGALIDSEVRSPGDLDRERARDRATATRLMGPAIIYHSLAGNVPGLSIPPIVCGLLARSVTLVRDSRRQPVLTRAFLDTLREIDPLAARLVVPLDAEVTPADVRAVLTGADNRVELHGSDAVVNELSKQFSNADLVEHRTRTSAVIATAQAKPVDWAQQIAHDIVMYEGLGCLTPHALIVEGGGAVDPWCDALADALAEFESTWPRRRQSLALESRRRAFLEEAEVSSLLDPSMPLLRGQDDTWCIAPSRDAASLLGPGMRCVRVVSSPNRGRTLAILESAVAAIAAIGVTMEFDPAATSGEAVALRSATRASLVCSAGRMQAPPLRWEQDGGRRLGDLLAWRPLPA